MSKSKSAHLVVTAAGAATSLGGVAQAMAAARAGIARPQFLGPPMVMDEDEGALVPVIGHPVSFLTRGFVGMARLARLGALAINDLLAQSALQPTDLAETALLVALGSGYYDDCVAFIEEHLEDEPPRFGVAPPPVSELVETRKEWLKQELVHRMLKQAGLPAPAKSALVFEDHVGFSKVLELAAVLLGTGPVKRCIIGGVDSWCGPDAVSVLNALGVLKTPENAVGFMPGEAAAFLVVENSTRNHVPLAVIESRTIATAIGAHQFSPAVHGDFALADALSVALTGAPESVWAIGTQNGTSWSAAEWGRNLLRTRRSLADALHWLPALHFGDTGAAASALGACMVVRAFARRYAPADSALVWASGPRGSKGAFLIRRG